MPSFDFDSNESDVLQTRRANATEWSSHSAFARTGARPFVQTEAALLYFHYVYAGYILPAVLAVGLVENGVCVLVLTSLSCGIGRTARVYYITLSFVDMCLLVAQSYNMWLSMGLQYATGGAFYLDVVSGFGVSAFGAVAYNIVRSPYLLGPFACLADTSQTYVWIAYRAMAAADLYIGPPLLSAALCVALLIAMQRRQRARRPLLAMHTEEEAAHQHHLSSASKTGSCCSHSGEAHHEHRTGSKKDSLQLSHESVDKKGSTDEVHHKESVCETPGDQMPSDSVHSEEHKCQSGESMKREPMPPYATKNAQRRETVYKESPLARSSRTSTPNNQSSPTRIPKSESLQMPMKHGPVNEGPALHAHMAACESDNCLETVLRKRLNTNDSLTMTQRSKRHRHHVRDRAIRGAVTAAILALVHAAFYLPTGVLGLVFYHCMSIGADERLIAVLWALYFFSMTASAMNSLVNLYVYAARIPAFRRRLLGRALGVSTMQHTSEHTHTASNHHISLPISHV